MTPNTAGKNAFASSYLYDIPATRRDISNT